MKAGWEVKPLGEVYDIGSSKRVLQSQWTRSGVPFYRAREVVKLAKFGAVDNELFISEDHFARLRKSHGVPTAGDLMVSAVGTLGACYVVQEHDQFYFKDASVLWFRPKSFVEAAFVKYAFEWSGLRHQVIASDGATVGTFTISRANGTSIPLPPLEEQQRIVAVLDEAFEGLTRARAHAEANLQSARELFDSTIGHIFSRASDWPCLKISEIGRVFDGPHATPKTVAEGPLFLGISSLVDGRIELAKTRHVTDEDFARWTKRVTPRGGDVVFSYETRLGQVGLIPDGMKCCLGRRMGLVRLNREVIDPEYFVLCYLSPEFQKFLREKTIKGATVDRLSIKDFPDFGFPTPTLEVQEVIIDQVRILRVQLDLLVERAEKKLQSLDALRQSLLQKAFAGELS
ncbi:MAG: restriction endonuclease subunit S [Tabrizicola sp.]|uniref:restriction endonuclease subunit S n=1 Tax=Tabrizicola sp. TaxID=2005166 RepID=UPI002ABBE742|nr:restriction endonuclease subunit S [Tabrizicola sp.]MDZ4086948.1 restriction endonuclease subunit S [Tabrizicola sp.]